MPLPPKQTVHPLTDPACEDGLKLARTLLSGPVHVRLQFITEPCRHGQCMTHRHASTGFILRSRSSTTSTAVDSHVHIYAHTYSHNTDCGPSTGSTQWCLGSVSPPGAVCIHWFCLHIAASGCSALAQRGITAHMRQQSAPTPGQCCQSHTSTYL